ncbi:MAG: hypothetical protein HY735_24145 [Verrucomicrobia bacterium]|nr:hypothetical protein [Verrucomicrobiota bacterium]
MIIKEDGSLWAWGHNASGQWGDGTDRDTLLPIQVGRGAVWIAVAAGSFHTAAIKFDRTLWASGDNAFGQLGGGGLGGRTTTQIQVGRSADWEAPAAGAYHTVAIKSDGSLWAWGDNRFGQLGEGTFEGKTVPTQVGQATDWKALAAGMFHTVALKLDGSLWAWGDNSYRQLGDGAFTKKNIPTQVGQATDWKALAAGGYHTVAIRSGGTLWAWGRNFFGQLGDGTSADRNVPTQIGLGTNWMALGAGEYHTVAIKSDGTLWTWGNNEQGQLGDGTFAHRNVPAQAGQAAGWVAATAGDFHTAAVKSDGTLWSWGYNAYGQLGSGSYFQVNIPKLVLNILSAAPAISAIPSQVTSTRTAMDPIPITLSDSDIPLERLSLSAESSDSTVVHPDGITFGGSGARRTLNIVPDRAGKTSITVQISDGTFTNATWFELTVLPGNDDWANAMKLTGLDVTVSSSNREATKEPGEPEHAGNRGGKSVWWTWTAPVNCSVRLSTEGSAFDTTLSVYTGDSLGALRQVAGNNDSSAGNWSLVEFQALSGITYRIAVDGFDGRSGDFALSLHTPPTISGLGGRRLSAGEPVGPIQFVVSDSGTTAFDLAITATSSNPAVVPQENIVLAGTGVNRTISVTPAPGNKGTAAIIVRVTDGAGNVTTQSIGIWVMDPRVAKSKVAAGSGHTVLLKADGGLWAWGANTSGQLGDGTFLDKSIPTRVGQATNWAAVGAGESHTVALKSDGTLWAWGSNTYGQLGDGTFDRKNAPIQVGRSADWLGFSAGNGHTVALKSDGTLWSWGSDYYGQLGVGTAANDRYGGNVNAPTQIGAATDWVAVSAGDSFTVALKSNGTLWAWGSNYFGQLGDGTNGWSAGGIVRHKSAPIQVGQATDWIAVVAGRDHTVAIKAGGTLWGWGRNYYGQLGDRTSEDRNVPTQVGQAKDWVALSGGFFYTDALKTDGTLWAWGSNFGGQTTWIGSKAGPTKVGQGGDWVDVAVAIGGGDLAEVPIFGYLGAPIGNHVVALKADGTLWTWGMNSFGQLGITTFGGNQNLPRQVGQANDWAQIAAGTFHTLALKSNGTLWEWGDIESQTFSAKRVPSQVGQATNWVAVDAGEVHSAALKADGTLWTWGSNNYGALGYWTGSIGGSPWVPEPRTVGGSNWMAVAAGGAQTMALKSDGTLWSPWGGVMSQIGTDNDWAALTVGGRGGFSRFYYSVHLKSDGTLWADYRGTSDSTPWRGNQIGRATDWVAVSAGTMHALGLKSNGTLWAWGANERGQLGDGTFENRNEPTQVGSGTNWIAVSAGGAHTVALRSDRTLWAWGANDSGQLGDGTFQPRHTPLRVGLAADWSRIAAGTSHTAGIKTDGTLWTWGYNATGQLGNCDAIGVNAPRLVLNVLDDPPVLSAITNHFTTQNVPVGPITIAFTDSDTPLADLKFSAESSNSTVVQPDGFTFGGSGAQRTLTIAPMPDAAGRTTITVQISDGSFYDRKSFELLVGIWLGARFLPESGQIELSLRGGPGRRFVIEVSDDLRTWRVLREVTLEIDEFQFIDAERLQVRQRFYRALAPQ